MYESLTCFIPKMQDTGFGEWVVDRVNDGSPEHPKQFPFVAYSRVVTDFENEVYRFIEDNQSMELTRYGDILNEVGITWGKDSMRNADVSSLDGRTIMALIVGAIRAERFCDGILLEFCEDGILTKWLARLQQIDGQQ